MPIGIRGLVVAGVFATAMGSLSAALNALATSATNDWYIRCVRATSEAHHVAARGFTVVFALLMIVIAGAFAYAKVTTPTCASSRSCSASPASSSGRCSACS